MEIEPTVEDSIKILKGAGRATTRSSTKIRYTNEALKAAVELSARYITDRKLPDKAIDIIDEAGASQMLVPESRRKKVIGVKEVEGRGLQDRPYPRPSPSPSPDTEALRQLEVDLKRVVLRPGPGAGPSWPRP